MNIVLTTGEIIALVVAALGGLWWLHKTSRNYGARNERVDVTMEAVKDIPKKLDEMDRKIDKLVDEVVSNAKK